jgi:mRNA-degrading endonuclease YafQ of YafQ-DinJ toxin-antitoxin module
LLANDPYNPILRTHKLKGKLSGAYACSVEYDCRIIFSFEYNQEIEETEIMLIDIGTHDEVY